MYIVNKCIWRMWAKDRRTSCAILVFMGRVLPGYVFRSVGYAIRAASHAEPGTTGEEDAIDNSKIVLRRVTRLFDSSVCLMIKKGAVGQWRLVVLVLKWCAIDQFRESFSANDGIKTCLARDFPHMTRFITNTLHYVHHNHAPDPAIRYNLYISRKSPARATIS